MYMYNSILNPEIYFVHCSSVAKFNQSSRKRAVDVYPVRSLDFQNTIQKQCNKRNDAWGFEVFPRLSQVIDLPAAGTLYHQTRSTNFRTGKNVPKTFLTCEQEASEAESPGRPEVFDRRQAFQQIVETM